MFINPRTAIDQGWVKFPNWMSDSQQAKCVQPNALDFTVDRISAIANSTFTLSEDKARVVHRRQIPIQVTESGWFNLMNTVMEPETTTQLVVTKYDFQSDFYVDLPQGVAALVIARSSLTRNGMFLTTGLWDSGFKGHIAGVLHNDLGPSNIECHVRIGQIMFIRSEFSGSLYTGGYNTEEGQHWSKL